MPMQYEEFPSKRRFSQVGRWWNLIMPIASDDLEREPLLRPTGNAPGSSSSVTTGFRKAFHWVGKIRPILEGWETSGSEAKVRHGIATYLWRKMRMVISCNLTNILIPFIPIGIIAGSLGWNDVPVFVLNFLAIVPLAAMLSYATEQLEKSLGPSLGGLINATFGNVVELIVSVVALTKGEIRVVQASMLGSILSNVLLVLGCCFFLGGLRYPEQNFNALSGSTMASLMAVATTALVVPAALYATLPAESDSGPVVLKLSRWTAILMLLLYITFLLFSLKTHFGRLGRLGCLRPNACACNACACNGPNTGDINDGGESGAAVSTNGQAVKPDEADADKDPTLSIIEASVTLLVVTMLVSICAEYLVGAIEGVVETSGISKTFIGLILIPIVGNAAEHATAIVVAMKDKMDLAISVAIGSSVQIGLFVTPFLVVLGWVIGQPMSLHFQTFETIVFFVSSYMVYHTIADGKSNYLEGAMLLIVYTIIAISFYVYPEGSTSPQGI